MESDKAWHEEEGARNEKIGFFKSTSFSNDSYVGRCLSLILWALYSFLSSKVRSYFLCKLRQIFLHGFCLFQIFINNLLANKQTKTAGEIIDEWKLFI